MDKLVGRTLQVEEDMFDVTIRVAGVHMESRRLLEHLGRGTFKLVMRAHLQLHFEGKAPVREVVFNAPGESKYMRLNSTELMPGLTPPTAPAP